MRPDAMGRSGGDARSLVNVGAGSGSYEPKDRFVVAVDPSVVMISQRPADDAPAFGLGSCRRGDLHFGIGDIGQ